MSQNDFVIANQTAPNFRADLNLALQALASTSSGSTAPSTTYANMLWYDTANNILKMRSEADDAWIDLGTLDQSTNTFTPAGVPSVGGSSDAIPTTSGTSASFTGIPAGVQRVTVALNSVDIVGTDSIFITLGTASGIVTSGYSSSFSSFTPTGQDTTSGITAAFGVTRAGSGSFSQGEITFTRTGTSSNIWTGSGQFWSGDVNEETSFSFGTSPNLGGELTQIRVASAGGTNSLDSGSFRVFWSF